MAGATPDRLILFLALCTTMQLQRAAGSLSGPRAPQAASRMPPHSRRPIAVRVLGSTEGAGRPQVGAGCSVDLATPDRPPAIVGAPYLRCPSFTSSGLLASTLVCAAAMQVKTSATAVATAPMVATEDAVEHAPPMGDAAAHALATGAGLAAAQSRKQKQALFRQAQQLLLQQQERLEQLRGEVTALQSERQQLHEEMVGKVREAKTVRQQLAKVAAAASQLQQAKEAAEATAEEMRQQLAAAVDQAASMQDHASSAQQEELEAYKQQLHQALQELQYERQEREVLKSEVGAPAGDKGVRPSTRSPVPGAAVDWFCTGAGRPLWRRQHACLGLCLFDA